MFVVLIVSNFFKLNLTPLKKIILFFFFFFFFFSFLFFFERLDQWLIFSNTFKSHFQNLLRRWLALTTCNRCWLNRWTKKWQSSPG